jgi:uncharacterized protein YutE (UPF0331/DUF86 family)
MDNIYRTAMKAQVAELAEELEEILLHIEREAVTSKMVYRSAERSLQLLTEACIGIAKQSLKGAGKEVPADARKAFSKLRMLGMDSTGADWNKIIGMRNALVHDYLNLDPDRIMEVIKNKHYQTLLDFAEARLLE